MYPLPIVWFMVAIVGYALALPAGTVTNTQTHTEIQTGTHTRTYASPNSTSTAGSPSTSPSGAAGTCAPPSGTSVTLPSSAPANAPEPPADFIGFGFETAFINEYANEFSENLVNNIANRVGAPVIIRVGGTSGDRIEFDPNQSEDKVCVSGDCPIGSSASYILGPSYFDGFKAFPNQHFTFQAPMGNNVNTSGSLAYVTRAWQAIGASRVAGIALGNEVNAYGGSYSAQKYVNDALALEKSITGALGLSSNTRIFEVVDSTDGSPGGFSAANTLGNLGLDSNGAIKYYAQHWYQWPSSLTTYTPQTQQENLMSHNAIVSKFNSGYGTSVDYLAANDPAVAYIISEAGTSLIGPPLELQDSFGGALWVVDWELYCMSKGIKRVDQTGRPAAPHSLWVPNESANDPSNGIEQNIGPQVRGPYYAMPLVADFLGSSPGPVTEIYSEDLATAYAMYDSSSGKVAKVALVNLKFWAADVGGTRGSVTFDIPVHDESITSVTVQRLRSDSGAHAIGYDNEGAGSMITYAGETWSYKLDGGNGSPVSGVPKQQTVKVCGGVASVKVPDSEAVLVFFS